jgi:4-amino-4-deoxy-L-arabinose transferase-like glycosyltransferase
VEETNPILSHRRGSIAPLLVGGLFLVVMGQIIYQQVYPQNRWLVLFLVILGLLAFGLAVYLMAKNHPPHLLARIARYPKIALFLSNRLGISTGQLILLLLAPCYGLLSALAAGDGLKAINLPVSLIAWLLAITFVLAGSYQPSSRRVLAFDRQDLFVVTGIFLFAFVLRVLTIGSLPATLSGDEGSAGLMAMMFLNGEADNIFTVGWFSFPTFFFAIQSIGIAALGQTAAGLRITSALGGALTIVGVYFLARTLFGRTTAILAAIFLSAFHYHIHFSRIGLNNIWDGLFAVVVMAGLWHGWKSGNRIGFMISGLALGLGQYFYVSFRIFPLLLLFWAGLAYFFDRPRFKERFADLLLTVYIAFVVVSPLLFFFLKHPEEFNAPLQRVTIFDGWLDLMVRLEGKSALLIIGDQMINSALGFTHLPLRHWYNPGSPLLLAAAAGLFLLGLLWLLIRPNLGQMLVVLPIAAVVVAGGFSQDAPASQRYVLAVPMVAILVAIPLAETTRWLKENWPRHRNIVLASLVIFMTWLVINDLRYYFFEVYDHYILGGVNTLVATEVAHYLDAKEDDPAVYFFGHPRMGYRSFSTIPYLVPDIEAEDVLEPLTASPTWRLQGPTVFIFLPERANEMLYVQSAYPAGGYQEFRAEDGSILFLVYEVNSL